jgi:hypothetical protein
MKYSAANAGAVAPMSSATGRMNLSIVVSLLC